MSDHDQERIRERAYALWESQGRPHGREDEHWHQASREVEGQDEGMSPAAAAEITRPAAAPKRAIVAPAEAAPVPKPRKKPTAGGAAKAPPKRRSPKG